MDEHMMAAEIAALKNEVETLKPLAAKGLRAEQAEREIETEKQRTFRNYDDSKDSDGRKQHFWKMVGLQFALDRLKGVE